MVEIDWEEWKKYRALLDSASSEEEKERIKEEFWAKYGDGTDRDPDDDRVLLAGSPTEVAKNA